MTSNGHSPYPVCGAQKKQGEGKCQRPAGWGTDHVGFGTCKLHGGRMRNHQVAAARAEVRAEAASQAVNGIPVDPATALLRCVQLAAGQVAYASKQIMLSMDPTSDSPEETANSPWGRVQSEAMDRLARYSKMALDAGATEKQINFAEKYGREMASILRTALEELELTKEQKERAPEVIRKNLLPLETSPSTA
jgi:hypothetical protein